MQFYNSQWINPYYMKRDDLFGKEKFTIDFDDDGIQNFECKLMKFAAK